MPKFRIKIKDAKSLKDSIEIWKKKIRDADFDLTRTGVVSIANSLMEKKEEIASTTKFADLRDIVKEQVGKFDTPKSREILAKVDELDRMYQRDPRPGSRNDYWVWDKLLRYVYNILLKASGSPSPDVKETKSEDSVEVEDNGRDDEELKRLIRLLGQAHNFVIEADELAGDLAGEGKIPDDLVYAIEDLEAETSELDFEGENDPLAALKEKFEIEETDEDYDEYSEELIDGDFDIDEE
jgi:hypothetical protein